MFNLQTLFPAALLLVSASVQAASPLCSGRSLVKGKYTDRVLTIFFENEDKDDVVSKEREVFSETGAVAHLFFHFCLSFPVPLCSSLTLDSPSGLSKVSTNPITSLWLILLVSMTPWFLPLFLQHLGSLTSFILPIFASTEPNYIAYVSGSTNGCTK